MSGASWLYLVCMIYLDMKHLAVGNTQSCQSMEGTGITLRVRCVLQRLPKSNVLMKNP
jgi:hypothetical protein